MKALVTGAAGFIGSHLTGTLLDRGAQVTGVDCFSDYYARSIKEANLAHNRSREGFRFVEARIQDADLPGLLDGVTHVFHLAAQAGVRKSWGRDFRTYTDNNVDASQRLLEACVGLPLHRFVYASSSSIYGDNAAIPMREDALPQPVSPYGVTKLAAEQLCYLYHANHGVPATSLRYFTVYGPRQRPDMGFHRFIRAAIKGDPITLYGDGECRGCDGRSGKPGSTGACVQHRRGFARLDQPRTEHDRPDVRPPSRCPARAGAEGGHARHIRGYGAREGGSRLRTDGVARRWD